MDTVTLHQFRGGMVRGNLRISVTDHAFLRYVVLFRGFVGTAGANLGRQPVLNAGALLGWVLLPEGDALACLIAGDGRLTLLCRPQTPTKR